VGKHWIEPAIIKAVISGSLPLVKPNLLLYYVPQKFHRFYISYLPIARSYIHIANRTFAYAHTGRYILTSDWVQDIMLSSFLALILVVLGISIDLVDYLEN
jgi:hypothetical protein